MVHSAEEMTNELLSLGGIMRSHALGNVWVIIEGMLGLSQHDYMYVYVDKNDGMKKRFFMSLGHDGDHPASSDHWCIYGWIIPWVPSGSLERFPRWGDMDYRPEEPLGESIGDEQDWSNGTYGIGCGFTNAGSMAYYEPKNGDEIQHGHEELSFTT